MRLTNLRWEPVVTASSVRAALAAAAADGVPDAAVLNVETVQGERLLLDPALTAHDAAVFLLHVAAEVEHALLAQYLYAAWSVGGSQIPVNRADEAEGWRQTILEIAREEMAHLITVQNLLLFLGGPLTFDREDYPFRTDLYPFPFKLQRLTAQSLARYVVAEMPPLDTLPEPIRTPMTATIIPLATQGGATRVNRVGALYAAIIELFRDSDSDPSRPSLHLADADFVAGSEAYQAKAEDWGYGNAVMVPEITTRAGALSALEGIAEQGEGPTGAMPDLSHSHFKKFFDIFAALQGLEPSPGTVPESPTTTPETTGTYISDSQARDWAYLFNLRYRMLLDFLHHFLLLPGPLYEADGDRTSKGLLQLYAFREMRRLAKIGRRLMVQAAWNAGPPFELPYTLSLPDRDSDRWRVHTDVFDASSRLIEKILTTATEADAAFLRYVTKDDAEARANWAALAAGQPAAQPVLFRKVVTILDEAVRGFPLQQHGPFWRNIKRDDFIKFSVFDSYVLVDENPPGTFHGATSNLVKVLRGKLQGIPRMPFGRPAVPEPRIAFIEQWIDGGCRDNDPPGLPGIESEPTPMPAAAPPPPTPAKRYSEIKQILENAVNGDTIHAHGNFWRTRTRDQFIAFSFAGLALIAQKPGGGFDPDESNFVKALEGRSPFGSDLTPPTPGATKRRMPAGRAAVPADKIAIIRQWIADGCPDDEA
jgi:hypothetical protein